MKHKKPANDELSDESSSVSRQIILEKRIAELEKQLEEANQKSLLLETLLEALPDGVYLKDKQSRFVLVNEVKCRHYHFNHPEQLYGKTDHDFYPKEEADKFLREEQLILKTGIPIIDEKNTYVDDSGKTRSFLKSKYPCYDSAGNIIGTLGINRDITELSEARDEAVEKLSLLKSALNAMPDSFYLKDTESRFVLFNERFSQLCGLTEKELIGRTDHDLCRKELADEYRADELRVMETGEPMVNKVESFDKDGQIVWLATTKVPYVNAQGQVAGTIGVTRNITDLKTAQQESARQLKLLQTLMESLPDMVSLKDTQNRLLYVNRAFAKRFAHDDPSRLIGMTDHDLHPHDEADIYTMEEKEIIRTGKPIINESNSYVDPEGIRRDILKSKIPCYDENGKITGILGINRDITVIKQAQRESSQRLKLLQTVINALPDPIYLKDKESRFILVNQSLCELFSLRDSSEIIGKTDFDFDYSGEAKSFRAEEEKIIETGIPIINMKEWFVHRNGAKSCVIRTKIPYHDESGQITGILGINRDITTLEKTREELDQKLDLLQMLIDHIPDYIYVKDVLGHIVMANVACVRGAGLKKLDDMIGKTDFDQFSPEQAREFHKQEQKVLADGHPQSFLDECTHTLTGQKMIILSTKIPLKDAHGNVIGLVGIGRDMTDIKKQEQALLRTEKLAAVGTLAAGTAHQFNNLLAIIMGTIELCLADGALPPAMAGNLRTALDASAKANVIVKDLLAFARQTNKVSQQRVAHVNEVVETSLRMLEYELQKDKVTVDKKLGALPDILLDPDKLAHVVLNLVVNARHAVAGKENKKITITTGIENNRAFIRVEDNGCGIPADHINSIFDPFFTTKGAYAQGNSEQARFQGVGLGLSVCNSIINEHGGLIDVSSVPGQGAVFTVWLPIVRKPGRPDGSHVEGRVLVVDDEPIIRRLITQLLSKEGYIVEQAADGEEGLHRILNGKYDAVFTDISMPRLGGVEMLQVAASKLPPTERPSFIVISGYADDHEKELKVLAVHGVLDKPFSNEQLLETARHAIAASKKKNV